MRKVCLPTEARIKRVAGKAVQSVRHGGHAELSRETIRSPQPTYSEKGSLEESAAVEYRWSTPPTPSFLRDRPHCSGATFSRRFCVIDIQMRMLIELDDAIIGEIDAIAGPRRRNAFAREAIFEAVERHRRNKHLRAAAGVLRDSEHEWDDDSAGWVSRQRGGDPRRVG